MPIKEQGIAVDPRDSLIFILSLAPAGWGGGLPRKYIIGAATPAGFLSLRCHIAPKEQSRVGVDDYLEHSQIRTATPANFLTSLTQRCRGG
ncbi:MAG TPA: hypothetical protein VHY08_25580 [Bacillota bacterium]|nr:hypothetical protein [Bacillota bacterium]